jgi:hypothetical protein
MSVVKEFTKGFWQELPPFRLVLGLCPTLAVTTAAENGIGMGLATTFVLVFSNVLVSILRKLIPSKVRIASYIVVIASFVVMAELLLQAYWYPMYKAGPKPLPPRIRLSSLLQTVSGSDWVLPSLSPSWAVFGRSWGTVPSSVPVLCGPLLSL